MRKRTKVLLMLCVPALFVGVRWFSFGPVAKSKSPFTPSSLEEKASKAKDGDEDAVRDLADQVFYQYGHMFPTEVQDAVKNRVVRAEVEYKKNGKGRIRETNVVQAVNFLAENFKAPDFAKTDHRQVRILRAQMRFESPSFIAPDPKTKKGLKKKIGEPMNPEISPLEATCLVLVMLNQKALNNEFQQTTKEFAVRARRKPAWLEVDKDAPAIVINDPRNIEKSRAVLHAVTEGVARMRLVDAINLADEALDKLSIKN